MEREVAQHRVQAPRRSLRRRVRSGRGRRSSGAVDGVDATNQSALFRTINGDLCEQVESSSSQNDVDNPGRRQRVIHAFIVAEIARGFYLRDRNEVPHRVDVG